MEFRYQCVSADNHMRVPMLPANLFQDRVDSKFKEQAPRVVETAEGRRQWVVEGRPWGGVGTPPGRTSVYSRASVNEEPEPGVFRASTVKYRLEDMDRDGVDAEIFNGPFETLWSIKDPDLRVACTEAVNNWIREFYEESGGRLIGLFPLPSMNADEAVREMQRVATLGVPTGVIFDWAHAPQPVWHAMWEPLWVAAAETGLPVNLHVGGGGTPQGGVPRGELGYEGGNIHIGNPDHNRNVDLIHAAAFTLPLGEITTGLVLSGILDRNPKARFVIEEAGIGWVPYMLNRMDREYDIPIFHHDFELSARPSELARRQLYYTFEEEEEGGLNRIPEIGVDKFMWASDYPGADSPWPHSQDHAIKHIQDALGDEMTRKLTFENAVNLYNLAPVAVR